MESYGIKTNQKIELWKAVGCEKCHSIGYKGRIGIFEAILANDEIIEVMPKNPSEDEIKVIAKKQGILDMKEDGLVKAVSGVRISSHLSNFQGLIRLTPPLTCRCKGEKSRRVHEKAAGFSGPLCLSVSWVGRCPAN